MSQQDCEGKGEILYTVRPYERQGMLITLSDCVTINAKMTELAGLYLRLESAIF